MGLHPRAQRPGAGRPLRPGAAHDLAHRKVLAVGVLAVQQRGGDPHLVGDAELEHIYLVIILFTRYSITSGARPGNPFESAAPRSGRLLERQPENPPGLVAAPDRVHLQHPAVLQADKTLQPCPIAATCFRFDRLRPVQKNRP